ncbi:MAG: hypothetical protein HY562_03725 [Ignavibacteriales bacterium]|nr:hypothetical protein [Ignavibacteriales bacterium]
MKDTAKNRVLYGALKTDAHRLENVRCEVHLNALEPSNMKADIYDLDGTNTFRFMKDFMGKEITFEYSAEDEEITFSGTASSGQITGASDRIGSLRIDGYRQNLYLNRDPLVTASFMYYLTPVEMFKRRRMKVFHDMKGLLFGYDDWTNQNKPLWKSDSHSYQTVIGELVFYPGLVFEEDEDGEVTVRDQTKVTISMSGDNIDIEKLKTSAENILENYLHIISFLENRFVYWFYGEIDARSTNGKGIVSSVYKWIPTWEYRRNDYIERHSKEYRDLVPTLVEKYLALSDQKRLELDKAIKQLLVAAKPDQPVDTELIYWHSCLDMLLKILSGERTSDRKYMGFSRKLVLACEEENIEWADLYAYARREDIFSDEVRADFKITTFRNNMISSR